MSLLSILPNDILILIKEHLKANIIQNILKLHRPMTKLQYGDRIIINKNIYGKNIYGTIKKIYNSYCKIQLLPRIIPNWKRCNINFWKNYEYLLKDYCFPYYIPRAINISKKQIIKLNNWNVSKINNIDGTIRINLNKMNDTSKNLYKKSNMFGYYF